MADRFHSSHMTQEGRLAVVVFVLFNYGLDLSLPAGLLEVE